jgi:hypothetical protein
LNDCGKTAAKGVTLGVTLLPSNEEKSRPRTADQVVATRDLDGLDVAPPSVSSRPLVHFRSTQTSALGHLQPFRASKGPQSSAHLCPIRGSRTPEKSSGVNAFSSLRLQNEHSATFTTFLDDCPEIFVLNAEPAHCRSHIPSIGTIRI